MGKPIKKLGGPSQLREGVAANAGTAVEELGNSVRVRLHHRGKPERDVEAFLRYEFVEVGQFKSVVLSGVDVQSRKRVANRGDPIVGAELDQLRVGAVFGQCIGDASQTTLKLPLSIRGRCA